MDTSGLRERLERLLTDGECAIGCRITVHDRTGALAGLLPRERFWHDHAFCQADREQAAGYSERCFAHCLRSVNARMADPAGPSAVHRCWKGGSEACAAIHRDGVHSLTLFGGVFRGAAAPPPGLTQAATWAWRALPRCDARRLTAIANVLHALGQAMVALLDAPPAGVAPCRRALIERLIASHLHRGIDLERIAAVLHLSPSRTAHVVAEEFGLSLGDLLRQRRIARAKHLLRISGEPVAAIAAHCGFADRHWFSRLFTRAVGASPAKWRRRQRAAG